MSSNNEHFLFETNCYVQSIERIYKGYNCDSDTEVFDIIVSYRNGKKSLWTSNILGRYGNGLFVDSTGRFVFGCSLRGVYCCDLNTGKKIWKTRKMAKYIVMNADDTLTCEWHKTLFRLNIHGDVLDELKTNYDTSIFHIDNGCFLIRMTKSSWYIVSSRFDKLYQIPSDVLCPRIRCAIIDQNILQVKYWRDNGVKKDFVQSIELSTYAVT